MDETDLVGYLVSKGISAYRASGLEITAHCFFCPDGDPRGKGKLYLNTETWLYDCVTAETEVVTRDGTFPIKELVGRHVTLLTHQGWQCAPVGHYGVRDVYDVVLTRDQNRKVIRTTHGHRWFLGDGTEVITGDLQPGMRLASVTAPRHDGDMDPRGIQHGIVFGDGAVNGHVNLHGEKLDLQQYVTGTTVVDLPLTPNGVPGIRVNGTSRDDKLLPSMTHDDAYLYGWLAGYFATDGTYGTASPCIDSVNKEALQRVREVCDRLGIPTSPIKSYWHTRTTGLVRQPGYLHRVTIHRSGLTPEFFLRSRHRDAFDRTGGGNPRLSWRVVEVKPAGREDVYCAVVDGAETFALADNLLTGNCKRCQSQGNRKKLMDHFGDVDTLEWVPGTDPAKRLRILREATELAHLMLLDSDDMLTYLLERGLTPETIEKKKYGFVPRSVGFTDSLPGRASFTWKELIHAGLATAGGTEWFNESLLIPYWSHGQVVSIREKKIDGKYRTCGGDRTRVYNADSLWGADDVVVTEGEFDCDIVEQALLSSGLPKLMSTAVVGLPGAGSWPDGLVDYFDQTHRVFLGLDPDDTGRRYTEKLATEIGNRARRIELPDQLPKCDWTNYLRAKAPEHPHGGHTWTDVAGLMAEADLSGKRMFSVSDAHTKWDQRQDTAPGIALGWPGLDASLRPGLKPGQIMIPLAKTGVGKSIFLSNIAHNLANRYVLYVSLELTAEEIFEHLRRIHRFWHPTATDDERDLSYANLRIVDQNRIGKGDLKEYIREYTDLVGRAPEVVIVDYLQYYSRGFRGDQYTRVSDATMELKAVAKESKVALICPSQVNRGAEDGKPLTAADARDSGVIEETGDFVLALYRPDQIVDKDGNLGYQSGAFNALLAKSRHGGKGRVFNLKMSLMSLVIVDAKFGGKAGQRVEQENALYRQGIHYDDYRKQLTEAAGQAVLL
jgi:archaellum biogenesis ATPase FlaH